MVVNTHQKHQLCVCGCRGLQFGRTPVFVASLEVDDTDLSGRYLDVVKHLAEAKANLELADVVREWAQSQVIF